MKTTFQYDHYYKYDEIKSNIEYFTEKYPDLVKAEVNCVTLEGRNQYAVTITNQKTGDALSKPGWYLDGNIHAGEVTSCMAAMHTMDYLITNYGEVDEVTKLLDTTTIYIIPRVTPDGAETYLSTPYMLRSANREYMVEKGGMYGEDLDSDGVMRMMRIPTPYGAWKKDPADSSVMMKREPSDTEGEFYDIYTEGMLEAFEGDENLKMKKTVWGLDFNRNFPFGWWPEPRQDGAGKYPLSNPECKALADFVLAHPNIGGAAIGHTSGGLILYPPGTKPEKAAPSFDMKVMKEIAEMGKQELGYKPMNIFDSFIHDQDSYDSGAFDDWCYQTQGIPCYTMEFWDVPTKAGKPHVWGGKEEPSASLERYYACVKWVKENAPQYYSDWKEFDHPVFGKVEIGGINFKFTLQNPPENFLQKELENDTKFNIRFAKAMPKLAVDCLSAEKKADGVYEITAVIGNPGYLPTNLTEEAVKLKTAKPVIVDLEGAEVIGASAQKKIDSLAGFSGTVTGAFYGNISTFANAAAKKKLTWIVKAAEGTVITVKASQEKAGKACKQITL
ncbi:MAG: zinc carboxypeptidase [Solobacterium sp.]|nr:zinc carboxypeptidase [Solobacterium sp.]